MGVSFSGCFAMVNNDLLSLVNTRPLKFWKETLALLYSVNFVTLGKDRVLFCDISAHCLRLDAWTVKSIFLLNPNKWYFVAEFFSLFHACSINIYIYILYFPP